MFFELDDDHFRMWHVIGNVHSVIDELPEHVL
jgi:hypothetical protein